MPQQACDGVRRGMSPRGIPVPSRPSRWPPPGRRSATPRRPAPTRIEPPRPSDLHRVTKRQRRPGGRARAGPRHSVLTGRAPAAAALRSIMPEPTWPASLTPPADQGPEQAETGAPSCPDTSPPCAPGNIGGTSSTSIPYSSAWRTSRRASPCSRRRQSSSVVSFHFLQTCSYSCQLSFHHSKSIGAEGAKAPLLASISHPSAIACSAYTHPRPLLSPEHQPDNSSACHAAAEEPSGA
jgi:hypothetical protein